MRVVDFEKAVPVPFNIALVVSRFNQEVTSKLLAGALGRLRKLGFSDEKQITVVHVPGAVEIPLAVKLAVESDRFRAVVALGAVIRGDTPHFDYVCQQVSDGCQKITLESGIPVIFGVLTTENEEQAMARSGGVMGNKGIDCVDAAIEMVSVVRVLTTLAATTDLPAR